MKVNVIFEQASDGGWSCYVDQDFDRFGLLGYGDTKEEALEDLYKSYEEMQDIAKEEGWTCPALEFVIPSNKRQL